jgi:biopolymer transport protein ExbB
MGGWADGRMWGQNVTELFERGGPVMWPLLACSVLAVALIAERVMVYWSLRVAYGPLLAELESRVGDGTLDGLVDRLHESPRPLHRVVVAYLRYREAEKPLRDQVVLREASQQLARYDRRLNWLGILTHATPLLGLLGTVAGLVDAFHQIELKGGQVQPGDLASGIWSALLTTVCGLTIALPCLAAYHLLQSVVGKAALQMQWVTSQLDEWLAAARAPRAATAPGSIETLDPRPGPATNPDPQPVA